MNACVCVCVVFVRVNVLVNERVCVCVNVYFGVCVIYASYACKFFCDDNNYSSIVSLKLVYLSL